MEISEYWGLWVMVLTKLKQRNEWESQALTRKRAKNQVCRRLRDTTALGGVPPMSRGCLLTCSFPKALDKSRGFCVGEEESRFVGGGIARDNVTGLEEPKRKGICNQNRSRWLKRGLLDSEMRGSGPLGQPPHLHFNCRLQERRRPPHAGWAAGHSAHGRRCSSGTSVFFP